MAQQNGTEHAQPWVRRPEGGYLCTRHDTEFGALESCGGCSGDPGPEPGEEIAIAAPTPSGCLSALALERQMTEDYDAMRALAISLKRSKVKGVKGVTAIAKLQEVIIKQQRAIAERIQRRDDEYIVRERERRLRARDKAH